jgi:hypothetical protein
LDGDGGTLARIEKPVKKISRKRRSLNKRGMAAAALAGSDGAGTSRESGVTLRHNTAPPHDYVFGVTEGRAPADGWGPFTFS